MSLFVEKTEKSTRYIVTNFNYNLDPNEDTETLGEISAYEMKMLTLLLFVKV